jgi:putative transposase
MTKISYAGYRFRLRSFSRRFGSTCGSRSASVTSKICSPNAGSWFRTRRVRRWVNHFGPMIAADLRKRPPKPHWVWHLDEVYLKIGGRMVYLWRAVDAEGEVLDVLVQSKRNRHAALKLMRKLLKKYAFAPERLVTDEGARTPRSADRRRPRRHHLRRRVDHRIRRMDQRSRPWSALQGEISQGLDAEFNRRDREISGLWTDPRHRAGLCQEDGQGL